MQSKAATPAQYLAEQSADRRAALEAVRQTILDNLDSDYEEGMQYGMIGYYVPHSVYPYGYHCDPRQPLPFAGLAAQKNHMAVYLMCVYGHSGQLNWFQEAWKKTGKKLDMGKSCIRFKRLEDLPLEVIGEAIRRVPAKNYIAYYEANIRTMSKSATKKAAKATPSTGAASKKAAAKKATTKKAVPKKNASKKTKSKKSAKSKGARS